MKGFIYIIKNIITHKSYVGMTFDFQKRFYVHKYELNQNRHHCIPLQRAWNKYGEKAFVFQILEEYKVYGYKELGVFETKHIQEQNSYIPNGYNLTKGGEGGDRRPIIQYDLQGNFINYYESITQASIELNIHHTYIWNCCNASIRGFGQKTCKNFQFVYEESLPIKNLKTKTPISKVYQYDLEGNYIAEWLSAVQAAENVIHNYKTNRSAAIAIRKCCQKDKYKQHTAFNYQWSYEKKDVISSYTEQERKQDQLIGINKIRHISRGRRIIMQSLEGQVEFVFDNLKHLQEIVGKSKVSNIGACLSGYQKTAYGFKWEYQRSESNSSEENK